MTMKKIIALSGAVIMAFSAAGEADASHSNRTFVFLKPETSSFWHTATNSAMSVPVDFPAGASAATLRVSGLDYAQEYEITAAGEFKFELPKPTMPCDENVYDLTLAFNDGTVRTAKLGLIAGLSAGAKGATRCLVPAGNRSWKRVSGRAVLPISYGKGTLVVDGVSVDTGLKGSQGWYALRLNGGDDAELIFAADEDAQPMATAALFGAHSGLTLIAK